MKILLRTFIAEFLNQRKNYFGKFSAIITLLVWPVLSLATTYYTYKSFPIDGLIRFGIESEEQLLVFLVSGALVYNGFWSMVQGAGQIRYDRKAGTLERIFLSPSSRLGFVYGRAFGGIIFNTWMFMVFSMFLFVNYITVTFGNILLMVALFIMEIIASTIWGGFITTLFLISRDSNIVFLICDRPMNFLSGTSVPVAAFPAPLAAVSCAFTATYCIDYFRRGFLNNYVGRTSIAGFIVLNVVLVVLTSVCLNRIENYNRVTGNWQLY